jgi:hypothetical protein
MYFLIMLIGKANDGSILLGLITTAVFVGSFGSSQTDMGLLNG